jgi:hypothetical protein
MYFDGGFRLICASICHARSIHMILSAISQPSIKKKSSLYVRSVAVRFPAFSKRLEKTVLIADMAGFSSVQRSSFTGKAVLENTNFSAGTQQVTSSFELIQYSISQVIGQFIHVKTVPWQQAIDQLLNK